MTDYVCIMDIQDYAGKPLFIEGDIYKMEVVGTKSEFMTTDITKCKRYFTQDFAKRHFKLKEEELPWL